MMTIRKIFPMIAAALLALALATNVMAQGRTTLRPGADFSSAERQAVPLLAEDLARNITSLLVDGSW